MAYLMAAIAMTLCILEGRFPIASLYECDFLYFWCIVRTSASAELLEQSGCLYCLQTNSVKAFMPTPANLIIFSLVYPLLYINIAYCRKHG